MSTAGPAAREPGFGVYVHWPFCAAKCPYCDFNSHVRHQPPDQKRFAAAFAREIAALAERAPGRTVNSIFIGGGTPSLMEPATVGAHPRCGRGPLVGRPRCRGDDGGQSVLRRGGALPRLSRGRRQPPVARRAGAQRSRTSNSSAACTMSPRRSKPSRSRGRPSRVSPSISSMPAPARRRPPGRRSSAQALGSPPTTCRSTSSPSSRARPSSRSMRPAS